MTGSFLGFRRAEEFPFLAPTRLCFTLTHPNPLLHHPHTPQDVIPTDVEAGMLDR